MTLLDETPDTRYLQLADTLAEAIRRGTLLPGDRLPAVRKPIASALIPWCRLTARWRIAG